MTPTDKPTEAPREAEIATYCLLCGNAPCECDPDYDPTPICTVCDTGRSPEGTCTCPPTAEHLDDLKRAQEHRALSQLASPASQIRSVQATTMAHLANVVHAEAAFRACTWNLLVHLSHQPYVDVVVSRRADKSAMGPVTIVDLWFRVGHYTFRAEGVASVKEVNGFVNITLA